MRHLHLLAGVAFATSLLSEGTAQIYQSCKDTNGAGSAVTGTDFVCPDDTTLVTEFPSGSPFNTWTTCGAFGSGKFACTVADCCTRKRPNTVFLSPHNHRNLYRFFSCHCLKIIICCARNAHKSFLRPSERFHQGPKQTAGYCTNFFTVSHYSLHIPPPPPPPPLPPLLLLTTPVLASSTHSKYLHQISRHDASVHWLNLCEEWTCRSQRDYPF